MNRLILIGNGFDLAHGLKTSYKDFIFWYLDECLNGAGIFANGRFYEDDFVRVEVRDHYRVIDLAQNAGESGISRSLYEKNIFSFYLNYESKKYTIPASLYDKYDSLSENLAHKFEFKSIFFEKLVNTCLDCGWVDIEQAYFDQLVELGGNIKNFKEFDSDEVRILNNEFSYLKSKLEEYLTIQDNFYKLKSKTSPLIDFIENFKINDISHVITSEIIEGNRIDYSQDINNQSVYALNFNYTNTFKPYLQKIQESRKFHAVEENHIHGQLNNLNNPIIFGFGDEHNKEYLQFEEQSNNDVFEHVKSYHYLKTANYTNLIRFLNQGNFRVYILGHSCGLSDRTMFKEIFDHDHCKSVRIFHYTNEEGKSDFFDKTINLGRHFTDKGRMRRLIINFNEDDAIPQYKGLEAEKEITN